MKKLFCSQPKLLICIELKIAEALGVCGVFAILYGIGLAINPIFMELEDHAPWWVMTLQGGLVAIAPILLFIFFKAIYDIIKANWAWAGKIKRGEK